MLGDASSEHHARIRGQEFIYVASGRGTVLLGGDRPSFDVVDYPRLGKRLYL